MLQLGQYLVHVPFDAISTQDAYVEERKTVNRLAVLCPEWSWGFDGCQWICRMVHWCEDLVVLKASSTCINELTGEDLCAGQEEAVIGS